MFNITSRYPGAIAVIFLIAAVAVSIYFYRNSSLSRSKKNLLISLKSLALFLLLTLFLEPSLLSIVNISPEPANLILIDGSRSIGLPFRNDSTKIMQMNAVLSSKQIQNNKNRFFVFASNTIKPVKENRFDSVKYDGNETNLSSGLKMIKDMLPDITFNSVVVVSDGLFNSGGNPLYNAKEFQCPFVTVGLGDTVQKKDLVVSRVLYNQNAFTNVDNEIKAEINCYGMQNENAAVDLLSEGNLVSSKVINVKTNSESDELSFTLRENTPGTHKYSIHVHETPGEITYKNNREDFLIHYIDSKVNILYVSDGPGYDNSLISSVLLRVNDYKVTTRIAKNSTEFYEGPIDYSTFGELSAVFLFGFPSTQSNNELVNTLAAKVKELNIPLIFFAGKNTDYKKLEAFGDLVPFSILKSGNETSFNPQLVSTADNQYKDIAGEVNATPQIFINQSGIAQKPGSVVLMTDRTTGEPVLITRSTGRNNSTAFLGYGIWRWRLNPKSDYEKLAENFLVTTINLTLLKEKKTKLKIIPAKDIFDYTEAPSFTAEVYDKDYQLTANADVKAYIESNGRKIQQDLTFTSSGNKFYSIAEHLPTGDYNIFAEAYMNKELYAKDDARFLVDTINTEYKLTASNFRNLRDLSLNTGGQFFLADKELGQLDSYLDTVKNRSAPSHGLTVQKRIDFRENTYVLILIIALFAVEWVLRKRNNLP